LPGGVVVPLLASGCPILAQGWYRFPGTGAEAAQGPDCVVHRVLILLALQQPIEGGHGFPWRGCGDRADSIRGRRAYGSVPVPRCRQQWRKRGGGPRSKPFQCACGGSPYLCIRMAQEVLNDLDALVRVRIEPRQRRGGSQRDGGGGVA